MATSLLSLALDHRLDPTIAMTGELTVTGKVLRIGGLREKAVAARRAGAKKIIFPADNISDWLELPAVSPFHGPLHSFNHHADIAADMVVPRTSKKAWKVTPQAGIRMFSIWFSMTLTRSMQRLSGKRN